MLESEEITPFGDLRKILVDSGPKVGIAKLRVAMKHFRGEVSAQKDESVDVANQLFKSARADYLESFLF